MKAAVAKEKIDLYKLHKNEYAATRKPALIKVGTAQYLAIEGAGAPGGEAFTASMGALYGVAFTVKMTRKFSGKQDYAVCKLEAQWWCDNEADLAAAPQNEWRWKLLIRTPDFIAPNDVTEAIAVLLKRGKDKEVGRVHLESFAEGDCVQMLHVGPYDQEPESIALMKAFAAGKHLVLAGRHHEIYLSDPRRVPAQRLKTILRIPVTPE